MGEGGRSIGFEDVTSTQGLRLIAGAVSGGALTPELSPPPPVRRPPQEETALFNQTSLEPAPATHARKLSAAPPPRAPPQSQPGLVGMLIKQFEGDSAVVVEDLTPGGPAASCGQIRVGDRLLAVDGRPVAGMALSVVHGLINGPAGGVLRLQMAKPREAGGGGGGGGGGGSGNATPRDADFMGPLSSACYSIASRVGGGGSGASTPRRQSQEQSRGSADRGGGAVYEVELVRAAMDTLVE